MSVEYYHGKRGDMVMIPKPIDGVPQCVLLQGKRTDVKGRWMVHEVKFKLNRLSSRKDFFETLRSTACAESSSTTRGEM